MILYRGVRRPDGVHDVYRCSGGDYRHLPRAYPRTHPYSKCYGWGEDGPAAERLARALLLDATGIPELAENWAIQFMKQQLTPIITSGWAILREEVLTWCLAAIFEGARQRAEEKGGPDGN